LFSPPYKRQKKEEKEFFSPLFAESVRLDGAERGSSERGRRRRRSRWKRDNKEYKMPDQH